MFKQTNICLVTCPSLFNWDFSLRLPWDQIEKVLFMKKYVQNLKIVQKIKKKSFWITWRHLWMLPHLDYPIPEVQLLPSIICHITKRNCFSSCNILFLFKTNLITVGLRVQDARLLETSEKQTLTSLFFGCPLWSKNNIFSLNHIICFI